MIQNKKQTNFIEKESKIGIPLPKIEGKNNKAKTNQFFWCWSNLLDTE